MRTLRSFLKWVTRLMLIVALVVGIVTFPAGWGNRLGTRAARSLPPLRNLPELAFTINYLSPTRLEISNIRLGNDAGAPAIRHLEARYSPLSLMQRTIRTLQITGLSGTFIQTSNNLVIPGRELIRQLVPAGGNPTAPSQANWRLLNGEFRDLQVMLRSATDDDEKPLPVLSGTFRTAWKSPDVYRLAWSGLLGEVPAWLNGEIDLNTSNGQFSASAPLVSSHQIWPIIHRLAPDLTRPPIDAAVAVSLSLDIRDGLPYEATLLATTAGPVGCWGEGFALKLSDVVAAGQWQLGDGMPGRLRDVTFEAALETMAGLPPELTDIAAGARVSCRLEETILSFDAPPPGHIVGELEIPYLARWTGDEPATVTLALTASPTQLLMTAVSPKLAGTLHAGEESADWAVGHGAVRLQADLFDARVGWRFAGAAGLDDLSLRHSEVQFSQAFMRLPIAGTFVPASGSDAHLELFLPQVGWAQAQVLGVELLATNLVPPAATTEPLRLAAAVQLTAPPAFPLLTIGAWLSESNVLTATINQPMTPITTGDPLIEQLFRRLAPAPLRESNPQYSGNIGLQAACDIDHAGVPIWQLEAAIADAAITLTFPVALDVSGIATTVRLDGAGERWQMRPVESVFTNAVANGIGIAGGRIRWWLNQDEVVIERAEFDWCGGKARLYAARIDLAQPDLDLILYIDSIDAGELIRLIKPLQGTATGKLYGRIPLRIRNGHVFLSEGFLYALPGEEGTLQLQNTQFLQEYLASAGLSPAIRKNVADALADLQYTVLRFDLSSLSAREAKLVMKLAGRATRDRTLPPVDLDIRLNGPLEALLNLGLQMNSGGH